MTCPRTPAWRAASALPDCVLTAEQPSRFRPDRPHVHRLHPSARTADYWSRSPAAQASTSKPNRRSRVWGRFASLIQKARILR